MFCVVFARKIPPFFYKKKVNNTDMDKMIADADVFIAEQAGRVPEKRERGEGGQKKPPQNN